MIFIEIYKYACIELHILCICLVCDSFLVWYKGFWWWIWCNLVIDIRFFLGEGVVIKHCIENEEELMTDSFLSIKESFPSKEPFKLPSAFWSTHHWVYQVMFDVIPIFDDFINLYHMLLFVFESKLFKNTSLWRSLLQQQQNRATRSPYSRDERFCFFLLFVTECQGRPRLPVSGLTS